MTDKTGYAKREYRIYGHRCTRRRYILEWYMAVGVSIAVAAAVVFGASQSPATWQIAVMAVGAFLTSMYYRFRTMNVNGYADEKPEDDENILTLFPWKVK